MTAGGKIEVMVASSVFGKMDRIFDIIEKMKTV